VTRKIDNPIGGEVGFSLVELLISMVLSVLILGVGVATFTGAIGRRERETSRTDALTSAQAALNIMSREIGNAGYGLTGNGLVTGANDCSGKRLHFRTNTENTGSSSAVTDQPGEDVTFFYDTTTQSVVRYDRVTGTAGVINRVSDVNFTYYDYTYNAATQATTITTSTSCSANTARVTIDLLVTLADVQGQPTGRTERVKSDVTLRNSTYMLGQY
jgi:type II secretory pathway pseudopilin PulG